MAHLIDTNVIVRLVERTSTERESVLNAIRKLRGQNEIIYYTPQVLAEFWNVCTRPSTARGGFDLSVEQTNRRVAIIKKYFQILPDSLATFEEWQRLVLEHQVIGVQVHDAKLVASMVVHRVPDLITFNLNDFKRFPMINAHHPHDV